MKEIDGKKKNYLNPPFTAFSSISATIIEKGRPVCFKTLCLPTEDDPKTRGRVKL